MSLHNPYDPVDLAVESALIRPISVRDYEAYLEKLVSRAALQLSGIQGHDRASSYIKGVSSALDRPTIVDKH